MGLTRPGICSSHVIYAPGGKEEKDERRSNTARGMTGPRWTRPN